jgi:hypothetical protein
MLLLSVLSLVDSFDKGHLSINQLAFDLTHAIASSHHHLHHEKRVILTFTEVKLLASTTTQDVLPEFAFIVVPLKFGCEFVDFPIETNDLYIRESLLFHD